MLRGCSGTAYLSLDNSLSVRDTPERTENPGELLGSAQKVQPTQSVRKPAVLCLFDHAIGNMVIHYSRTRILHPRQGLEDILEVLREEKLLDEDIKLIYLLAGRADSHLNPLAVGRSLEKLLDGISKINPRVMCVLGGVLMLPSDGEETRHNMAEINLRFAKTAVKDQHWLFFNPNLSVSLAGNPQRRFFDREGKLNKTGCRFVAQALVAASKAARMLQNFASLPPISA